MAVTALPEVTEVADIAGVEYLIQACDGVWDCMTSEEAINFVETANA